jgi:hybrid cluster-associated redox disulfide protein
MKGICKMKVTKDTIIGDVLDFDTGTAKFFFEIGMHCLGCPSARGESIEQACAVHGTNADELVKSINDFLSSKKN